MHISQRRKSETWPWLGPFLVACGGGQGFSTGDGAASADTRLPVVRNPDTGPGGLGGTCNANASPSQAVYNLQALECQSRLCIKPAVQLGAVGPTNTAAFCAVACTHDSDCTGEIRDPANPLDTRCQTGFACAIPFTKGPGVCCMHLCVCKDFLASVGQSTPIACQGDAGLLCDQ